MTESSAVLIECTMSPSSTATRKSYFQSDFSWSFPTQTEGIVMNFYIAVDLEEQSQPGVGGKRSSALIR